MRTELLAPVGSKEAFYAAIYNHADAIYLGGKAFGARAYADNFTNDELSEMISFAHLFGVKVYVTVNTVVYDQEFPELISFLDFLYLHDCDAFIVQDIGVARLMMHRYPQIALHASTQMNIHSLEQVKTLKSLGFKRVVLAREVPIDDIITIKKAVDIELEVFVHGALCVSSSGNCYMSSIIGKRSGNRGKCAQPCRLTYSFNGKNQYLISPKDLNTLDFIPQLLDANIDSLKIEGRMKRPEYVAAVVQSYKKAINAYQEKNSIDLKDEQLNLKKIFNREFTKGWLFNETNDNFINEAFSNHIGIEIGRVIKSGNNYIDIVLTHPLNYGDAIRIKGQNEDAMVINQMYVDKKIIKHANAGQTITIKSHMNGLEQGIVFLTTDQTQIDSLRATYEKQQFKLLVLGHLFLWDEYLGLQLEHQGSIVKVKSNEPYQLSTNNLSNERLIEQIMKTGNSLFTFSQLTLGFSEHIFLPIKQINELRRMGLEKLTQILSVKHPLRTINDKPLGSVNQMEITKGLVAKVRSEEQLQVVANYPFTKIYVTDEKLMALQERYPLHQFIYVIPRINTKQFTDEVFVSSDLSNIKNNHTSIYLPVTNAYALYQLYELKAKRVGISLELSFTQIKELVQTFEQLFQSKPNIEMMVYGRYELMMMKYCLVKNNGGCQYCAETTDKQLVDRRGFAFPIFKDSQCYVKILNSKKLHLGDYIQTLYENGVTNLLLDFTIENAIETKTVCEIYCNNNHEFALEDITFGHFKEGVL
ncbi:MAG: DUF3656 domain-containing protein [Bacilli bacterium]